MSAGRSDSLASAALKLLAGGVISSIPISMLAIAIIWGTVSTRAGLSCTVGAGAGLVAMALSQAVLAGVSKLSPKATMMIALGTYAVAIAGTIAMLIWIDQHGSLTLLWVATGVVVAAFAYILGVALAYPKLRILLYSSQDTPESTDVRPKETE